MRLALATAFLFIVTPVVVIGQSESINPSSLQIGTRARILGPASDSKYTFIKVASAKPDSLRFSVDESTGTKSLAWHEIRKMDASVGGHRHFGRGLGLGLTIGALGGLYLGSTGSPRDEMRHFYQGLGTVAGGVAGAVLGGVLGFAWRSENWIPVALPHT
jgi:hypothetical protein